MPSPWNFWNLGLGSGWVESFRSDAVLPPPPYEYRGHTMHGTPHGVRIIQETNLLFSTKNQQLIQIRMVSLSIWKCRTEMCVQMRLSVESCDYSLNMKCSNIYKFNSSYRFAFRFLLLLCNLLKIVGRNLKKKKYKH